MAKAKQPVTLSSGGKSVTFDALLTQTDGYESTVPAYPIETGFEVADTIIIGSPTLQMSLYLAKTPVTWKNQNGIDQVEQNVTMLENLYFQKELCEIATTEKSYSDMAIESMSIVKSEDLGYDKQVDLTFKKVIVTSTKTTSIPDSYGKSGSTMSSSGAASTTTAGTGTSSSSGSSGSDSSDGSNTKSSILYELASGAGLLDTGTKTSASITKPNSKDSTGKDTK